MLTIIGLIAVLGSGSSLTGAVNLNDATVQQCCATGIPRGACELGVAARESLREKARWYDWKMFVQFVKIRAASPAGRRECDSSCVAALERARVEKKRVSLNPFNKQTYDRAQFPGFVTWIVFPTAGRCPIEKPFDPCWKTPGTGITATAMQLGATQNRCE